MTYFNILKDSKKLLDKIVRDDKSKKYVAIFPIPSGGIAPGILISHWTGLKCLSLKEYLNCPFKELVLIIDDLIDSGTTMKKYPESDWATLYIKPNSPKPTYWLKKVKNEWLELPHEKGETGIEEHIERIKQYGNNKTLIEIKTSFTGFHRWINAPEEVKFLREWHRHQFGILVQFEVELLNREKEFFIEKTKIDKYLKDTYEGKYFEESCEMIAKHIFEFFKADYVRVDEDNQNAGIIKKLI